MSDTLSTTGLDIYTLAERRALIAASLRSAISTTLDLSPDQPTGQHLDIPNERIQAVAELVLAIFSSFDPDAATGRALDAVSSITGTYRDPATNGEVALTVTFSAAGSVLSGDIVAVSGDPDNRWIIDDTVTDTGGPYPEAVAATATAENTGAIDAAAGTITVIVTPRPNWTTVTNALDATPGEAEESDTSLRLKREIEVAGGGSTSVIAVRAEVSALDFIDETIIYENPYHYAVAPMPPNSIEVVAWDTGATGTLTAAQRATMAETIFTEKAGGIQPYGTDIGDGVGTNEYTYTDSQGIAHQIGWTMAAASVITIVVSINGVGDYDVDAYEGDAAMTAAIVAWGADLTIGEDVVFAQLIEVVMSQPGLNDYTAITINGGAVNVPIGARQIASILAVNITINS